MESGQIFVITIVALVSAAFTLSAFAGAWAASRKRQAVATNDPRLDAIEARLARMEDSIESVAVEMERIAEGQRFTARLLSERAAPAAQPAAVRAGTQHELEPTTPR